MVEPLGSSGKAIRIAVFALLASAAPLLAVDGVIEINQARALAGGVTPDDTPGFPVTISEAGSYRDGFSLGDSCTVTGNTSRSNGRDGIRVTGSNVIGNTATFNVGYGLNFVTTTPGGYANNLLYANNSTSSGGPQVTGGFEMGTNVCGGDTTCPWPCVTANLSGCAAMARPAT